MARSNGDLIAKARQMVEDVGRRPASVAEARQLLGTQKMKWPPSAAATAAAK
jgi:3-keto-5-aminohexanoate cleavage enzyme